MIVFQYEVFFYELDDDMTYIFDCIGCIRNSLPYVERATSRMRI